MAAASGNTGLGVNCSIKFEIRWDPEPEPPFTTETVLLVLRVKPTSAQSHLPGQG